MENLNNEKIEDKPADANPTDGSKSETISVVERADNAVKRLEETEKRVSEKIKQLEDLEARRIVSGRAEAGIPNKTPEQQRKQMILDEIEKSMKRFNMVR